MPKEKQRTTCLCLATNTSTFDIEIEDYCDANPEKKVKGEAPTWTFPRRVDEIVYIYCKEGQKYSSDLTLGMQTTYTYTKVHCSPSTSTAGIWYDIGASLAAGNGRGFCA